MVPTIDIPARVIAERMQEIDDAIKNLNAERDWLRSMIERAERGKPTNVDIVVGAHARVPDTVTYIASIHPRIGVPLTEQLVEYVRERPGQTSSEIASALIAGGFNKGREPRKVIQTSLGAVVTQGRIRKEGGRHYPV